MRAVGQALGQPPPAVQAQWAALLGQLHSLEHAPKMNALLELLQQSGIAPLPSDAAGNSSGVTHVHQGFETHTPHQAAVLRLVHYLCGL